MCDMATDFGQDIKQQQEYKKQIAALGFEEEIE